MIEVKEVAALLMDRLQKLLTLSEIFLLKSCFLGMGGKVELMVHRRLLVDDNFGVGEALDEQAFGTGLVVRGKHWASFTTKSQAAR